MWFQVIFSDTHHCTAFQGLHGMPGPKVRPFCPSLFALPPSICILPVTMTCCVMCVVNLQGEPGIGIKGEKGDAGAPGYRVS